jgi:DsbC/DsbD-like thiol-disulfide interchange protein
MRLNFVRATCVLSCLMALSTYARAAASASSHHLTLSLVSEQSAVVPGKEFTVALHFALEPGWHVYWINPGDSGEPPRVEWELPPGFSAGDLQWPTPRRISDYQVVDYGYEDELVLLTRMRTSAIANGNADLKANVKWAVCREVCIADRAQLTLSLPVAGQSENGAANALFDRTRARLPANAPRTWRVRANETQDSFVLTIDGGTARLPLQPGMQPVFFPLEKQHIDNAAAQKVERRGNSLRLFLKKSENLAKPPAALKGVVAFAPDRAFVIYANVTRQR